MQKMQVINWMILIFCALTLSSSSEGWEGLIWFAVYLVLGFVAHRVWFSSPRTSDILRDGWGLSSQQRMGLRTAGIQQSACVSKLSQQRDLPTSQPGWQVLGSLGNSLLSSSSFDFWACRNRYSPTVCSSASLPSGVAWTSQAFSQFHFYFCPFRLQLLKYWSISAAFLSIPLPPPDFGDQKLLCAPQAVCSSVSCW